MVLGAITATYVGEAANGSAALKTLLETINVGAATAGADTTSIIIIPTGYNVTVWKYVRAAA
jgi:hypothetical protein